MFVRDYQTSDLPALEEIHNATGFDYKLPSLDSPLVLSKKVALDDRGTVIGTLYIKLQGEAFLSLDPHLDPQQKMETIHALNDPVVAECYSLGLDQLVASLPPGIEEVFQKRLKLLGWEPTRENWKPWSKDLV